MQELNRRQKQSIGIKNLRTPNPFARPLWPSLFRGPGLPRSFTGQIDPPETVDVPLIFDSIRQIVETRPGERLMIPQFGSRIFELIGEPLSQIFEYKVQIYLTQAVKEFEPRARIVGVNFIYLQHEVHITYGLVVDAFGDVQQSTLKIPRG